MIVETIAAHLFQFGWRRKMQHLITMQSKGGRFSVTHPNYSACGYGPYASGTSDPNVLLAWANRDRSWNERHPGRDSRTTCLRCERWARRFLKEEP